VRDNTISALLDSPEWPSIYNQQAARGLIDVLIGLRYPAKGIEVGLCLGMNSWYMLSECHNISKLIGIDHYEPYTDWDRPITRSEQERNFVTMQANLPMLGDRFYFIHADSRDAASQLEDDEYDFVFIDGGHSMRQVLQDLDSYYPKVRSGGIVSGHDSNLFSVNFAVSSWTKKNGIRQQSVRMVANDAWYFVKQ
jgi:predicted O-methyltransferase YrrM